MRAKEKRQKRQAQSKSFASRTRIPHTVIVIWRDRRGLER
jgi:hypothetical protein